MAKVITTMANAVVAANPISFAEKTTLKNFTKPHTRDNDCTLGL